MTKFESYIYTGPVLEWTRNITINVCASRMWPATMYGCLAMLVSASEWLEGLVASSERAVTGDRTFCNRLDRSSGVLVTGVRSNPHYDGASYGYGEMGVKLYFHRACWCAIAWRWGTLYDYLGISYIFFVPKWFPVITTGPKYQHNTFPPMLKISFANHPNPWKIIQV